MRSFRSHLTFANIIACLALFFALGGASYAATQLPKNSIGSKQIKKGSIQLNDLSKAARDRLAQAGARGPAGSAGARGATGASGQTGPAGPQTSILASGQTLRGSFNVDFEAAAGGNGAGGSISFGLNLPQAPKTEVVPPEGAPTANCPGSSENPQASRGFFCVYEITETNSEGLAICDTECESNPGAEAWGAELYLFALAKGRAFTNGTWAVTAP